MRFHPVLLLSLFVLVSFVCDACGWFLWSSQAATSDRFQAQGQKLALTSVDLVSRANTGQAGNGDSFTVPLTLSADGRYLVFTSSATNLLAGQIDTNQAEDVFLLDRSTGITRLVSRAAGLVATTANGLSSVPKISGDGRFVTFLSRATNLVPGQIASTQTVQDVFLFDRLTETTVLVSHNALAATTSGNAPSYSPFISSNGQKVVYYSDASDLVAGQIGGGQIYLYDMPSNTNILVSHAAGSTLTAGNGFAGPGARLSTDGRFVIYNSEATNLVVGQVDVNNDFDVFAFEVASQTNSLVSRSTASPQTAGNRRAFLLDLSSDGNLIVFGTDSGNLIAGQNTGLSFNTFLFDRQTGTTSLVSHIPGSAVTGGNSESESGAISGDGNTVVFLSFATDLVTGLIDSSLTADVFAFDRTTGTVTLVSRMVGTTTTTGNGVSFSPFINQTGSVITFTSRATNLVMGQIDQTSTDDVFVFDRSTGITTLVSHTLASNVTAAGFCNLVGRSTLNQSGTVLAFTSSAPDLAANDGNGANDVFVASLGIVNLNFPTVNPAVGVTRQQGSTGTNSVLAAVSDVETQAGALTVAVTAPAGISVTGLTNNGGTVSATITAACGAPLGSNSLILRVTDGDGNITSTAVTVTITANTPPTVGSYQAVNVALGSPTTVTPSAPPTDNGTVATVTVTASAGFSGPLTVNPVTGVVSFTAGAEGTFTLTVTATDNCGSTTPQSFSVTVLPFGKGPVIGSLSPTSGPAGTSVTISGLNLTGVTQVTFNGRPAAFTVNAATQITATVPIGAATGPVAVAGPNGAATGPVFTVIRTK
ncbi:MAG: hypothetical protein K1Y36_07660 [Blastocatellia bacterium]|nr:hypothetical protein [Blastocatellia bacterium]